MSARVSWEPAPPRKRNVLEGQSALAKVLGLHASTSERFLEEVHVGDLQEAMVEHPEHARDIAALVKAIREHGSIILRVEYQPMSAGAAGLDARLAALSQPMREAVLLRVRGRLRPSEIARRMGVTTDEVMILLRAAAKELGLTDA